MNENIWNADGTWNIIKNATQATCHSPMCPISSDIQSPVSSKLWLSRSFRFDGGNLTSSTLPLLYRLPPSLFDRSTELFWFLHKWSLKFTTLCQRSGFDDFLARFWAASTFVAFNWSFIDPAANKTFCRRFSPVLTGSEAILPIKCKHENMNFFPLAKLGEVQTNINTFIDHSSFFRMEWNLWILSTFHIRSNWGVDAKKNVEKCLLFHHCTIGIWLQNNNKNTGMPKY